MKINLYRLLLCISMAVALFPAIAGCEEPGSGAAEIPPAQTSTGDGAAGQQTLEVAAFEGGFGRAYFDKLVEAFEAENPGVKITLICSPRIEEIVRPRIVAGNPPDVLMSFGVTRIGQMANEGDLLDLTDIFDQPAPGRQENLRDIVSNGLIDTVCMPLKDGRIYLAPTDAGAGAIYYNETLFAENGWNPPETWDEFFALGDKAREEGIYLFTYQGIYPGYVEMMLMPAIASTAGIDAFERILNYEEGAWKDPDVTRVMEVFARIADENYLLPGSVAMNHTQSQSAFIQGRALFIPCGSWLINEMRDVVPETGFSFGFMPTPTFERSDTRYLIGGCSFNVVTADSSNPELAKQFIQFTYREDMIKLLAELNTSIMPVNGAVDLVRHLVPEAVYNTFKVYDSTTVLIPDWAPVPVTGINIIDEIYDPLNSVMNGRITVAEWADSIEGATAILRREIAAR